MALIPVTPNVLRWAIEESGEPEEEVASRVHVDVQVLREWLQGKGSPNGTQVKALAAITKRPPAVFLLPFPPRAEKPGVQFRHPPKTAERALNPKERLRLREAWRLQKGLAWLQQELGHDKIDLPRFDISTDAERAARQIRAALAVPIEEQKSWTQSQAAAAWRSKLEDLGLYVFFLSFGEDAARGFSVWHEHAPVIAVNTHWAPTARIFTMFHELGHIVLRTSSACEHGAHVGAKADPVERWCERFAAALLLPWDAVTDLLKDSFGWADGQQVTDTAWVTRIANKFNVSRHAAAIRLIENGAAQWGLYHDVVQKDHKPGGGGSSEGRDRATVRLDSYGVRSAVTFLTALRREVLTPSDVGSYLDLRATDIPKLAAAIA